MTDDNGHDPRRLLMPGEETVPVDQVAELARTSALNVMYWRSLCAAIMRKSGLESIVIHASDVDMDAIAEDEDLTPLEGADEDARVRVTAPPLPTAPAEPTPPETGSDPA